MSPKRDKRETLSLVPIGLVPVGADQREPDVTGGIGVHLGDLQGVESVPGSGVDLSPARHAGSRVTTTVVRPGSGRPIESYVFRPMIST